MTAAALMVLGTSSHAGKTAVAAGLCRLLARRGLKVAPFKAQNMSNNSHVTPEGGEIGRAQALQARAAGVESHTDMNPVLLKPSGGGRCQVVLHGKPWAQRGARDYYDDKAFLGGEARRAYDRLAARFDAVVLEGAGSPAEINLRDGDFVNGAMAAHAGARCLLVADIDRGGVFAGILGTLELMEPAHRALVGGVIINKFRGDASLLDPGIREIEARTGVPVLGVLPWLEGLGLEEEDSLGLPASGSAPAGPGLLDIAAIRLPRLSNATDLQPLASDPRYHVRYVEDPRALGNPDLSVLPGSKAVRADLGWLGATGLARALAAAGARHVPMLGLCGGYQMLGREVSDPTGVDGDPGTSAGLGLLPSETVMEREKELARVRIRNVSLPFLPAGMEFDGYEIHHGRTAPANGRPAAEIIARNGSPCAEASGAVAGGLPVFGLYAHGMFDSAAVRDGLADWLLRRKGWEPASFSREARPDPADRLADALEELAGLAAWLPALGT